MLSKSFGSVADEYDRYRFGPSEEALDWLLPGGASDALEIGAGTGLLTRPLMQRVPHVTAVEPDDRMRAVLAARTPGAVVVAGCAENLPVDDRSCDVVIAASAWHWVDERRGVPEVARVLRPGGRFSLVWNGTDRSVDWVRTLWAGGLELSPDDQARLDARRRGRHVVDMDTEKGGFSAPETALVKWTRPMTKEDLVRHAATYSAVITMEEGARRAHLDSMRRYLDDHSQLARADVIDVPMRAYCWRVTKR